MNNKTMNLYEEIKAAGIQTDNHESDLYFPVTSQSTAILGKYPVSKARATTFKNQVEGGQWYDIPFAFIPWWERREEQRKAVQS